MGGLPATVDVIPVLLLVFGLISATRPEWIAAIHRHQKATGTTHRPDDIEVTETWMGIPRVAGTVLVVVGLLFTIQSL